MTSAIRKIRMLANPIFAIAQSFRAPYLSIGIEARYVRSWLGRGKEIGAEENISHAPNGT
jgi:hypothetical protein